LSEDNEKLRETGENYLLRELEYSRQLDQMRKRLDDRYSPEDYSLYRIKEQEADLKN